MQNHNETHYNAGIANLTRKRGGRRGRRRRRHAGRQRPVWLAVILAVVIAAVLLFFAGRAIWGEKEQEEKTMGGEPTYVNGEIITEGAKAERDDTPILGGAELTMPANQTRGQMMSFLLETRGGKLIVVDGGRWEDGNHLMELIREKGGQVAAWFLTHAHTDHVGALINLLQTEADGTDTGIEVEHIYYNFADMDWYMTHELGDLGTAGTIMSLLDTLPRERLHKVERGQVISVDDVTVTVMNDRYEPGPDEVGERDGNDAGIAYRMVVNDVSILFLGDLQTIGGDLLLEQAGADALKSDMVQMAHHGQHGVSEAVYQAISPRICLWPTPDWLWENEDGSYETSQTKEWMRKLGVEKHYCIKDGDQVIR